MATRTRLKSKRLDRGMSIREAARYAGVGVGVIRSWESRERSPNASDVIQVARRFGLTWDDLVADLDQRRQPREGARPPAKTVMT